MVTLRRVCRTENNDSYLTLPSADPYTLWKQSKDRLSQTKLISLKSLGLQNVRVTEPHILDTLYINNKDADLSTLFIVLLPSATTSGIDAKLESKSTN